MTKVVFQNPKTLSWLKHIGYTAVNTHFHTEYSMDAVSELKTVVKLCEKNNMGVAITDHNEIQGNLKAQKMKSKDTLIIPSMEITTKLGPHLIPYFYQTSDLKEFYDKHLSSGLKKNPFYSDKDYFELVDILKSYNCLICAPHPYGPGSTGVMRIKEYGELIKKMDLIEGINGINLRSWNEDAIKLAIKLNKPMTAGSDGHASFELDNCLTYVKCDNDVNSFLDQLKRGHKNVAIGREEVMYWKIVKNVFHEKTYLQKASEKDQGALWLKAHFEHEYNSLIRKMKTGNNFKHMHDY